MKQNVFWLLNVMYISVLKVLNFDDKISIKTVISYAQHIIYGKNQL